MPRRLEDYVPHGNMSLAHVPPRVPTPPECDDRSNSPTPFATPPLDTRPHPFQTRVNKLGVFRRYTRNPTWHPLNEESLALACDSSSLDAPPPNPPEIIHEISSSTPEQAEPFAPFTNYSTALFMQAYFSGSDTKSEEHANTLAKAMEDKRFRLDELKGFSAQRENARLDKYIQEGGHPFKRQDGWHEASLDIRLPIERQQFESEDKAPTLSIPRFFHRRITDIIRSVCTSRVAEAFHFTPYTMHWSPDPLNPERNERIYGDTYLSDVMVKAQTEVDSLPRVEGDTKERVVLGLMLASDCAQLTSFGLASVWPIYLMFANQSKRERAKPSCHAVHHLAYAPSVRQLFLIDLLLFAYDFYSSEMTLQAGTKRRRVKHQRLPSSFIASAN